MNKFTISIFALGISLASLIVPHQAKAQESWNVTLVGHIDPASSYSDVWGYVDSSGTEYALLCSNEGIKMVDLANPANPTVVSTFGGGIDVKAFDHYVVTSGGGIYDVSDVTDPVLVATLPSAHNIFVSYPYLFLACPNWIYDISDPTNPVYVRDYGSDCHDVTVINDTLYHAGGSTGTEIFDISDINNHVLLTSFHLEGEYAHNVWPTEDRKYLLLTDELGPWGLTIWDIRDMSSPERVAQYKISSTPHNVNVRGNYAYVSHYTAGLRVLDVADPTDPVEVGFLDTYPANNSPGFNGAWGVYAFLPSELLLISDRQTGLYVAKFDSVEAASVIGFVRDAADSTAVEGAQVTLVGPGRVTSTELDGEFSFRTADGEDTLYIYKFGYHPDILAVSVLAGETLSVVIDLDSLQWGTITGMLTDSSGSGVAALLLLYLDGAPTSPWDTLWVDQGGGFEYNTFPGNYRVVINPVLPYVSPLVENVVVESGVTTTINLQLEVADVLLYNGDISDDYAGYYTETLDSLGVTFHFAHKSIGDVLQASRMAELTYPVAIWYTGDLSDTVISAAEEDSIISFLDAGGRIFLTGQNVVESLSPTSRLLTDYLQVSHGGNSTQGLMTAVDGNPVTGGEGLFGIVNTGGAGNQSSKDILVPSGVAAEAILYGTSGPEVAAVTVDDGNYKIFLTGFGFEGLNSGIRITLPQQLMYRALIWFGVQGLISVDDEIIVSIPKKFELEQNYPNPFNPETSISYTIPQNASVKLTIYNILGQKISTLVDEQKSSGVFTVKWNGTNDNGNQVTSGLYFYRLEARHITDGNQQIYVDAKKMLLLR